MAVFNAVWVMFLVQFGCYFWCCLGFGAVWVLFWVLFFVLFEAVLVTIFGAV